MQNSKPPETTGEFLERKIDEAMAAIGRGAIQDHRPILTTLAQGLYEHMYPGCRSCGEAAYHDSRALLLTDEINKLLTTAGELFAGNQDKEAYYLRDNIVRPMRERRADELRRMEHANERFHTCTKDGKAPGRV